MLIKHKRARTHTEDRHLALWLATSAGLLNAMVLSAFGIFPSHMTGNVSQLSSEISYSDINHLQFFAYLILCFVGGATLARLAVIVGLRNNSRTIYCLVLLFEGVVLTLTALYELYFHAPGSNWQVISLLAFLMGVHNATSTQLSNGRVRSTHVTGTLTDAGISLGSVLAAVLRRDPSKDIGSLSSQFNTHLITITSFLGGGVMGLLLFRYFDFRAMAGVGVVLMTIAVVTIVATVVRVKKFSGAVQRTRA